MNYPLILVIIPSERFLCMKKLIVRFVLTDGHLTLLITNTISLITVNDTRYIQTITDDLSRYCR